MVLRCLFLVYLPFLLFCVFVYISIVLCTLLFGGNKEYIYSSVSVAEWLTFGKQLITRLTICSLCIVTICNISYFPFWF